MDNDILWTLFFKIGDFSWTFPKGDFSCTKTMKAKAIDHTGNVTVSYWIEPNIKTNFIHQLGLLPKVTDVLPTDL